MASKPAQTRKQRLRRMVMLCLAVSAPGLLALALWSAWAERHPQQERQLRVELQEQLEEQFPAAMQPRSDRFGLFAHPADPAGARPVRVLLAHGLDEPGDIWSDLLPVLSASGFHSWEFRYPNDQGIDRSADQLAAAWPDLPADLPIVLIGHSMGGLVVRDFVSRWRHPVSGPPLVQDAVVPGVILVGTPNQGSDWARLRVLLEVRDQWAEGQKAGFAPLAGLQDGTGAAKIDLQPGSDFLLDLNARPWPESVRVHIVGATILASAPVLGDGVVAVEALGIPGAPPPVLVSATHRGMLLRLFEDEDEPPAIAVIMSILEAFGSPE